MLKIVLRTIARELYSLKIKLLYIFHLLYKMYYGAISTDIKKSSSNWNTFPKWMETAVMVTNNITEWVFNNVLLHDVHQQMILPNSPEGDAYTLFYEHHSEIELNKHLRLVASTIQHILDQYRGGDNDNLPCGMGMMAIKTQLKQQVADEFSKIQGGEQYSMEKMHSLMEMSDHIKTTYAYIGRIYLRIGIAVSNESPMAYSYRGLPSWRGGVIDYSEKAEQEAPWKTGYGEYNFETNKVEKKPQIEIIEHRPFTSNELLYQSQTSQSVSGYMIFVAYHYGITEEMMKEDPHLFKLVRQEFRDLHDEVNHTLGEKYLVKVKRDSASMYYIPSNTMRMGIPQTVGLINKCSQLISLLPKGSSIGIAYSGDAKFNRLKKVTRKNGVDFFGATVNMAARMEFMDFTYSTNEGITSKDNHGNRIAFGSWDLKDMEKIYVPSGCKSRENSNANIIPYPFKLDRIPVETLNAGYGEFIYVLSKKMNGVSSLKKGSKVQFRTKTGQLKTGTILDLSVIEARIQLDGEDTIQRRRIRRLKEIKPTESVELEEIKEFLNYKLKM